MKRLTCEMCGGTDFVKDGELFVCQSCGLKYTMETARKLMQDDHVDVSGSTVKVDDSDKVRKLLLLARRAREEDNSEDAKKYYELALIEDPENWESAFYASYYKVMESPLARLDDVLKQFNSRAKTTLNIILNTYTGEEFQATIKSFIESTSKLYEVVSGHTSKRHTDASAEMMTAVLQDAFNNVKSDYSRFEREHGSLFELSFSMAETLMELYETAKNCSKETVDEKSLMLLKHRWDSIYYHDSLHMGKMYTPALYERYLKGVLKMEDIILAEERKPHLMSIIGINYQFEKLQGINGNKEYLRNAKNLFNDHRAARQKKFADEYWAAHPEEKKVLEDEKAGLQQEITDLQSRINRNSSEVEAIRNELRSLEDQKDKCGLFQFKEKKALQEKIDAGYKRLNDQREKDRLESDKLSKDITLKKQRIAEIDKILSEEGE